MAGTIKIYEVLYDTGRDGGPAGDGTVTARFRNKAEAEKFAATATFYGRPTKATMYEAPRRLAQRWGIA